MANRKVYVNIQARLIIRANKGIDINEMLADMDYDFTSQTKGADIEDTEIIDYEITDSK